MNRASLNKRRIKCMVLCAVMTFVAAAHSTAVPYDIVYAADLTGSTADHSLDSSEDESDTNTIVPDYLQDVCGEISMYRWERMTSSNYPKDSEWHPMLSFWDNDSTVLTTVAPSEIYLGSEHALLDGAKWFGRDGNPKIPDLDKEYNMSKEHSAALKMHYTANDSQLDPSASIFYTTGDKNCAYFKYFNIYDGNPRYYIRLSNGLGSDSAGNANGTMSDYYINLLYGDQRSLGMGMYSQLASLVITKGGIAGSGDFLNFKNDGSNYYTIFDHNDDHDDIYFYGDKGYYWAQSDFENIAELAKDKYSDYKGKIFFGTAYRMSAIKGKTTIGSGQVLSITPSNYIDVNNNNQSQNGVMLMSGSEIVVEKGGILSISANFINNGSIINNGGTIIIKAGGTIAPFRCGENVSKYGCGTIKCLNGDIIIKKGGALYAGLNDEKASIVPFYLDDNSTLINQGLLVYGSMRLGASARVELHEGSKTYGSYYFGKTLSGSYTVELDSSDDFEEKVKAVGMMNPRMVWKSTTLSGKISYSFTAYILTSGDQTDMLNLQNDFYLNGTKRTSIQLYAAEKEIDTKRLGLTIASDVIDTNRMPHIYKAKDIVINDTNLDPYANTIIEDLSI